MAVPHNRWDLLPERPVGDDARITVVVTHYEQHEILRRTLDALAAQTLRPAEIVVADDGSVRVPRGGEVDGIPLRVVDQADLGFRAAAARNLGASVAEGDILVFVDADTVPEERFVEALTARPSVCLDVLAVGRRRHGVVSDLPAGTSPAEAAELEEPAWLRDGYARSADLLHADGRSYRFVISAVMACRRSLFKWLGGFDERFVGYGGEDWDFAYRAWNNGAVLVHEPEAVAWHDGPDWRGREGDEADNVLQSLRLARFVPEPHQRGAPLPDEFPDVLADVAAPVIGADLVAAVHSLLAQDHRDLAVRACGPVELPVRELYGRLLRVGPWTEDQRRRARAHLQVHAPLPPAALAAAMALVVDGDVGRVVLRAGTATVARLTSTRALGRSARWSEVRPGGDQIAEWFGEVELSVS